MKSINGQLYWTKKEFCEEVGITEQRLYYLEECRKSHGKVTKRKLLNPLTITKDSGIQYKYYSESDKLRVTEIEFYYSLGLKAKEIGEILDKAGDDENQIIDDLIRRLRDQEKKINDGITILNSFRTGMKSQILSYLSIFSTSASASYLRKLQLLVHSKDYENTVQAIYSSIEMQKVEDDRVQITIHQSARDEAIRSIEVLNKIFPCNKAILGLVIGSSTYAYYIGDEQNEGMAYAVGRTFWDYGYEQSLPFINDILQKTNTSVSDKDIQRWAITIKHAADNFLKAFTTFGVDYYDIDDEDIASAIKDLLMYKDVVERLHSPNLKTELYEMISELLQDEVVNLRILPE